MFTPKADVPEWQKIYDVLPTDVGSLVAYDALDRALGRSFVQNRSPFRRALRELEQKNHRTLVNIPTKGYRVIDANEHADASKRHNKRARRAMVRVTQILQAADRSRLTEQEQTRVDQLTMVAAAHHRILAYHDNRITRVERALIRAGIPVDE